MGDRRHGNDDQENSKWSRAQVNIPRNKMSREGEEPYIGAKVDIWSLILDINNI